MALTYILAISIILQLAAAVLALRLIRVTGRWQAWTLIAAAIVLMTVRRCVTFFRLVSGDISLPPDMTAELVALAISVLMVAGVAWIAPLFRSIGASREELRRVNRALRTLSHSNQALVRITDEAELLQTICRMTVDLGGYRMAWVGFAEQDKEKTVRPVAHAGLEEGYLEALKLTWAEDTQDRGPTGEAIRTGLPYVVRNVQSAPEFEPWREEATKRGYASTIALPLSDGRRTFGVLRVYASEPDAFDEQEISLLKEMASDLAYGITAARTRAERRRAEEETGLLQDMTLKVGVAEDFHSALDVVLRQVCKVTGWVYGEAWIPMADGSGLEFSKEWYSIENGLKRFKEYSENLTFSPGEGVPGRAFSSKRPIWVTDINNRSFGYKRKDIARKAGFKSAMAIPVLAEDEVVAVMVFYIFETRDRDKRLINLVSTVATQLGSLMRRKRAEEELREAHRELRQSYEALERAQATAIAQEKLASLGRLTAGVSHEILNPLNIIMLNLHMLLDDAKVPKEFAEDLRLVKEQAERIVKISQNILYFSRQRKPERRELDLNETVRRTLDILEHDLRLGNIALKLELDEELPALYADQDQLQQVILNLATNARDAMPKGGHLRIATSRAYFDNDSEDDVSVELRIRDTGPGIPAEALGKIFDPFFTTKEEGQGTGLGLSICQGIVESHGGSIRAENLPDLGAAFVIRLPVETVREMRA